MTLATEMQIQLRLPHQLLFDGSATRLSATAADGDFGILPNHVDSVTALVPSVLLITRPDGQELIFGIDEGILVKRGHQVEIAVRRGVLSDDLENLRDDVGGSFFAMEDDERAACAALSRLEADMVRRFASLSRPHP